MPKKQPGLWQYADTPLFSGTAPTVIESTYKPTDLTLQPALRSYVCGTCRDTGLMSVDCKLIYCQCESGFTARCRNKVLHDCRNLSDGTLATLTGKADYATLEKVQRQFVDWVFDMIQYDPERFENWVYAWETWVEIEERVYKSLVK